MSTAVKILIGFVVLLVICGLSCGGYIMSVNNTCVTFENRITAQYDKNQNVYDNFWKTVKEVAQVPDKYAKDVKSLYKSVLEGRYGKNGSGAMWQWLKEHNPTLDSTLYRNVQQAIEAGRTDFKNNQTILIDVKNEYNIFRQQFPASFFSTMLGFPKIDLSKFAIVTSDETNKAFTTKKAKEVKVW